MPQTRSARKALRQSQKRRAVHLAWKRRIRRALRGTRSAKTLPTIQKLLDRAGARGAISRRRASRILSHLAKRPAA